MFRLPRTEVHRTDLGDPDLEGSPQDLIVRPPHSRTQMWLHWTAVAICCAFGIACLVVVLGPGDGTWALYAKEMGSGHRIYSDLGLNQQPLFPLVSLVASWISPGGIIGDRLLFIVVVVAEVWLISEISKIVTASWIVRPLLIVATFFTAIHFEAFRFDDYHALAECFVLGSLLVSLRYVAAKIGDDEFALIQGALAAGGFLVRVNEGLAIAAAVALLTLAYQSSPKRVARMCVLAAAGALLVGSLVLLLVRETPATWYHQTVVAASQAKGGGMLLAVPGRLVANAFDILWEARGLLLLFVVLAEVLILRAIKPSSRGVALLLGAQAGLFTFEALVRAYGRDPLIPLAAATFLASTGLLIFCAANRLREARRNDREARTKLPLVAYPVTMFFAGALSTGGKVYGLYFPLALAMLVGTLLLQRPLGDRRGSALSVAALTFLALVTANAVRYRIENPYSWLAYHVRPMFDGYSVADDDVQGPHVITGELRGLITPVCKTVGRRQSLLSLPYSFANYYCGIPVWHGYVQSFYDTSTPARIAQIIGDLEKSPPDFIWYQRQLPILRMHEEIFNEGRPLPHRELDKLIVEKVRSRQWTVVYSSAAYPPSTWYLIRTSSHYR